ncbi:A nuclease of the HNH/ENDO VII superfamily with conserved LHH [Ruminococcaceae bacterium FB2012]|nr:A nuclease of the HNH/ENDO VII superfamily with conserved LHH [Ruminococcaceae bacterium FB2012]
MKNHKSLIKVISLITSSVIMLTSCSAAVDSDESSSLSSNETTAVTIIESPDSESVASDITEIKELEFKVNTADLKFDSIYDTDLHRYMEDSIYDDLVTQINSDEYFIEKIETCPIEKGYIEHLEYNSKKNIYFGYTLDELDQQFNGKRYYFTLENGKTVPKEFENFDDTFLKVLKDVAIGTGVILFCITVSAVSAGVGAPAMSMIFAASAKTGTIMALSDGLIGAAANGIVIGITTGDMDQALKSAAIGGAEGFKMGAIFGSIAGGIQEASLVSKLRNADVTKNGLTLREAAKIQKESKYPLEVIKQFHSKEEYEIYKTAKLKTAMISNKTALVQDIDLNYVSELDGKAVTNLERMKKGYAPIEPATGKAYQLHHIGQKSDGTLAVLTEKQHLENSSILNIAGKETEIDRNAFAKIRKEFWESFSSAVGG